MRESVSRWRAALIVFVVALAACTVSPSPTPEPTADHTFVFGVILVGPRDDRGWSEAHYNGGRYVEAHLSGSRMLYLDNLNPDARPNTTLAEAVNDMVAEGARLLFITSDDFAADTTFVAEKHPDVVFIHISGDHVLQGNAPANVGNYMARMEFGKMIAGCSAALITESGAIGYLGPLINDETRRLANSAFLGARYCYEQFRDQSPNELQFLVEWIGFWFHIPGVTADPAAVSNELFDQGADVILSGIDTTEAITVAEERAAKGEHVWAVPYDYEGACNGVPNVCLGVPYFNWGPGYLEIARQVLDGAWAPRWDWVGPDWSDINNPDTSPVGYVDGPALNDAQMAQLHTFIDGLADGSITLFQGPLHYQDGSRFLSQGEIAGDTQIWFMPQLLEGMEGASE
ncbi:MAG: BMP family protein [Anaerolineae bacterium]